MGIEAQATDALLGAQNNLEMQNAMQALEGIRTGFGQITDMSNAHLRRLEAQIQRQLGMAGINLQRELGMGDLDLRRAGMEQERAMQELLMNLQLQGQYYGNAPQGGGFGAPPGGVGGFGGGGFGGPGGFGLPTF
jgi:hypothetical protein